MAKILLMEGSQIRPVESHEFREEAVLQGYLEQFPDLIPLDEVEDNVPPLVTIGREVTVRGSGAIDLLFIDSNGLLTIVETKLATNPEVRRAVIGQIIEYAAFVCQWDADQIERQANSYRASKAQNPASLFEALGVAADDSAGLEAVRSKIEE